MFKPVPKKCQVGLMQGKRVELSITHKYPTDVNHPARDLEVVWLGPRLLDSNEEHQGLAYGNVAFNMAARCLELLITKKGFNCYWLENFVWPQNTAVRYSDTLWSTNCPSEHKFSGSFSLARFLP